MRVVVERMLWAVAGIAAAIYLLSIAETKLYQSYLTSQFDEALHAAPPDSPPAPPTAPPVEGQPLGRLEIPSIHFSAIVSEGARNSTLRRSVGHVPGTARPGENGNVGLAGHRDTFFRHLGELKKNDEISLTTMNGVFTYLVESTAIVEPDESSVLQSIGRPTLTLITCYPFYYIGPAPKRFVVHAGLAGGP